MKTSAIIPLRGNLEYLKKSLSCLKKQTLQPDEVIVSDGKADEKVVEFLNQESANCSFSIRYIRQLECHKNGAQCRNNAIRASRGSILILLEESIVFTQNLLKSFMNQSNEGSFVISYPIVLSKEQSQFSSDLISYDNLFSVLDDDQKIELEKELKDKQIKRFLFKNEGDIGVDLTHAACCIWKHDLKKVNGFDEKILGWGQEYLDLVRRLYNAGFQRQSPEGGEFTLKMFRENDTNAHNQTYAKERLVQTKKGDYDCMYGLRNPVDDNISLFLDIK